MAETLCQAFADTFEGGGWVDAPAWENFDDHGKERWSRAAKRFAELAASPAPPSPWMEIDENTPTTGDDVFLWSATWAGPVTWQLRPGELDNWTDPPTHWAPRSILPLPSTPESAKPTESNSQSNGGSRERETEATASPDARPSRHGPRSRPCANDGYG